MYSVFGNNPSTIIDAVKSSSSNKSDSFEGVVQTDGVDPCAIWTFWSTNELV